MGEKDIVDKIKREVAYMPQFDGRCFICHKKFGKYFLFHHRRYVNGEKIYRDFINTTAYNNYILPIIKNDPNRFYLLCRTHHNAVEKLKRFKKDKFIRLVEVVNNSV